MKKTLLLITMIITGATMNSQSNCEYESFDYEKDIVHIKNTFENFSFPGDTLHLFNVPFWGHLDCFDMIYRSRYAALSGIEHINYHSQAVYFDTFFIIKKPSRYWIRLPRRMYIEE
jgi:hypothetical protein